MEPKKAFILILCAVLLVGAPATTPGAASDSAASPLFVDQALSLVPASYTGQLSRRPAVLVYCGVILLMGLGFTSGSTARARREWAWEVMLALAAGIELPDDKGKKRGRRSDKAGDLPRKTYPLSELSMTEETRIQLENHFATLEQVAASGLSALNKLLNVDALTEVAGLLRHCGFPDWSPGIAREFSELTDEVYRDLPAATDREIAPAPPEIIPTRAVITAKVAPPQTMPEPIWPVPMVLLPSDPEQALGDVLRGRKLAHAIRQLKQRQPELVLTLGELAQLEFAELNAMLGVGTLVDLILELVRRGLPPRVTLPFPYRALYFKFMKIRLLVAKALSSFEAGQPPPFSNPWRANEDA